MNRSGATDSSASDPRLETAPLITVNTTDLPDNLGNGLDGHEAPRAALRAAVSDACEERSDSESWRGDGSGTAGREFRPDSRVRKVFRRFHGAPVPRLSLRLGRREGQPRQEAGRTGGGPEGVRI